MADDPALIKPTRRRAFATGFAPRSGGMKVYGGILVGLFGLSAAIPRESFALFAVSAVAFSVAYYYWPLVRRAPMQLAVTERGLALAGLGVVAWDAIRAVTLADRADRSIRNAELHLALSRPIPLALAEIDKPGLGQQLMYRVWRVPQPDLLVITLEPMQASPEEIDAAIRAYL